MLILGETRLHAHCVNPVSEYSARRLFIFDASGTSGQLSTSECIYMNFEFASLL